MNKCSRSSRRGLDVSVVAAAYVRADFCDRLLFLKQTKVSVGDLSWLVASTCASQNNFICILLYSVFMSFSSGVRPSPVTIVSAKVPPPGTMGKTCSTCGTMTSSK